MSPCASHHGGWSERPLCLRKSQGYRIHAIAQAGWARSVVKHMPEVCFASPAGDRDALHPQAVVGEFHDIFLGDGLPETWPAGVRLKLGGGTEQSGIAADASENTLVVNIQIFAGIRSLGGLLAR